MVSFSRYYYDTIYLKRYSRTLSCILFPKCYQQHWQSWGQSRWEATVTMEQEQIYMDDNVTVLRQMYAKFPLNKNKNDGVSYLKLAALICSLRIAL